MDEEYYIKKVGTDESCKYLIRFLCKIGADKPDYIKTDEEELVFAFFLKHMLSTITLWNIFWPMPNTQIYDDKSVSFSDCHSAFIIIRNLYESVLILNYLIEDIEDEEKQLRNLVYNRNHFISIKLSRQNLNTDPNRLRDEEKKQLELFDRELKIIDEQIENNGCFLKKTINEQNRIRKNKSGRLVDFVKMVEIVKINKNFHFSLYRYLTNFAHPNALGLRHLLEGDQKFLLDMSKLHYETITALLLKLVKKYAFKLEITNDSFIQTILEYHLGYVDNFDLIHEM